MTERSRIDPLPDLAECLAEADGWRPDEGPLVRVPREALDAMIRIQGPGFASLAVLMRDEGYHLAVFHPGGPGLDAFPEPFVAVMSDREEASEPDLRGFDRDTVERAARAADAAVFTDHEDDDDAMLHGLAAVQGRRGSLLFVDAPAERIGAWLDALRAMAPPTLPVLHAGAFARPALVN